MPSSKHASIGPAEQPDGLALQLSVLEVACIPAFGDTRHETSQGANDLALGANVLAQGGAAVCELLGQTASAGQLYHVVFSPQLAAGLAQGTYTWSGVNALVRSAETGRIVGQGALQASGGAAAAATSLPMLAINVGMAGLAFQLWCIERDLKRLERKVDRVLSELAVGREARLFGHIESIGYALRARDHASCLHQIENLLPGLGDAAEEFRRLDEALWAEGQALKGRRFLETTGGRTRRVGEWTGRYLPIADCYWKAKLALSGARAAIGEAGNAQHLLAQSERFSSQRGEALKELLVDRLCLLEQFPSPRRLTLSELYRCRSDISDPQLQVLRGAVKWEAQSTQAIERLRHPQVTYTVRVMPPG